MLALAMYRSQHCPSCGGALAETTNPDNEGCYRTDTVRCFKCTALAVSAESLTRGEAPASHPHAVLHVAELRT